MNSMVLMDREEVAALVGCNPETIRRAQVGGKLSAIVLSQKLVRYALDDVRAWLKANRVTGKAPTAAI